MSAKILIVEDDDLVRTMLAVFLRRKGFRVITAEDGEGGLNAIKAEDPDLIISDIGMPNLDGIEMIKHLRATPGHSKVPILVLTAYDSGPREEVMSAGASDVLVKPAKFELIVEAINRLLTS